MAIFLARRWTRQPTVPVELNSNSIFFPYIAWAWNPSVGETYLINTNKLSDTLSAEKGSFAKTAYSLNGIGVMPGGSGTTTVNHSMRVLESSGIASIGGGYVLTFDMLGSPSSKRIITRGSSSLAVGASGAINVIAASSNRGAAASQQLTEEFKGSVGFGWKTGTAAAGLLSVNGKDAEFGGSVSGYTWGGGSTTSLIGGSAGQSSSTLIPANFLGVFRYTGVISIDGLCELTTNPWQIYRPKVGKSFFLPTAAPEPTGSQIKVYNGTAWETHPIKVYVGGSWQPAKLKKHNGSTWEPI